MPQDQLTAHSSQLTARQSGFTLIELLVTLVIVSIIIFAAVPNLNRFNESSILNSETNKMVSTLRQAQSNAQARVQPDTPCPSDQITYWIVWFTSNTSYSLATFCYNPTTFSSVNFLTKYQITLSSDLYYTVPAGCGSGSYIAFNKQDITFPCSVVSNTNFTINLISQRFSPPKFITVNKGGSIQTQ